MVGSAEIGTAVGASPCHARVVNSIELRGATAADTDAVWRVAAAQDTAWWGTPDGDRDDVEHLLEMTVAATGSLDAGTRVAVVDGVVVGVAMLLGHGQTNLAVDPSSADLVRARLLGWLVESGATQIDSPLQDADLAHHVTDIGFVATRSSFELERPAVVPDLEAPSWPGGNVPVPFRLGVDDDEVHEMIYSFWTDVPGHTHRPIEEWRSSILGGSRFDADLVVLTRADEGVGPVTGLALGRIYGEDVGWVAQLGVSPSARGLGLGRAILLETCHRLSRTRARIIGLGVEAENVNALGLYRSVGMEVAREWVHYGPA